MYAVIETGGKQYRVQEGDILDVEKLPVEVDGSVELGRVLLVADGQQVRVGTPTVPGARVLARVVKQDRRRKILVFKYKPKVNYRRRYGHRQPYTRLRIEKIEA